MIERPLQVVKFNRIRHEIETASEFIRTRLKTPVWNRGRLIEVQGAEHDQVKLFFQKFLHHQGLIDYKLHT